MKTVRGQADCGLAAGCWGCGAQGAWLQVVLGLTVISGAHLQKACLSLGPLKYLISEAYEALQENEKMVRNDARIVLGKG